MAIAPASTARRTVHDPFMGPCAALGRAQRRKERAKRMCELPPDGGSMRSRASYKGHPIHPALIPFPFAFLFGAFLFDVAGRIAGRGEWSTTGAHLAIAGIATALIAAVPGLIDYRFTVPPRSTAKTRATRHMLVNLSAVPLFAIAWWLRGGTSAPPGIVELVLEGAGVALLTAGGWMGGVLVNRNQIGVDPRYAGAGKWRESTVDAAPGTAAVVARSDELEVNQM